MMSAMSVFNESWQGLATQRGLESATKDITKTLTDEGKKIVDAVSKVKVANSNQTEAISLGLTAVAESATKTAQRLRSQPGEVKGLADTMSAIGQQLTELTTCATQVAENNNSLRETVGQARNTAEQLDTIFPTGGGDQCVSVSNHSFGRVVTSFASL